MASFSATIAESPEQTLIHGSPELGLQEEPDHLEADEASASRAAARAAQNPSAERRSTLGGHLTPIYGFLDFYNRIHIQYTLLDLGNVTGGQVITFWVLNAHLVPRLLSVITETGASGVALTEPEPAPYEYQPLEELTYSLTIQTDGPASIDSTFTFNFDVQDLQLHVIGTRLIIFPYEPDGVVTETLEWATDVLEAHDGTEQRISVRDAPRQRIDFSVITEEGVPDTTLRLALFDWIGRVMGVPIWWEMRALSAPVAAGSNTISVSTLYGDFRVGGLVMVRGSEDEYEVLGVESMTNTSITFTSDLTGSYDTTAVVMPVRVAYASTQTSRERHPVGAARTSMSFTVIDNINIGDITGQPTYQGDVLLDDANFMDTTAPEGLDRPVTVVDTTSGKIYQGVKADRARFQAHKRWLAHTQQEVWRIRRLLHHVHGGRRGFWLPSFRDDFEPTADMGVSASSIRVRNVGYTTFARERRPLGDLRITLNDGTIYTRQITASTVDGPDEVLSFDSALPNLSAIPVGDIHRVELIHRVRVADDRAKILHNYVGEARIDLNLVAVRE